MLKVVFATGGSGGHIFPAISVAQELEKQIIDVEIIFIGSKVGIEKSILSDYDYDLITIDIRRLNRYITFKNLLLPYYITKSFMQAEKILKGIGCDMIIAFGGFVSSVVILAAKSLGIPVFLQEQNSFPGLVTRLMAGFCTSVFLGNKEAKQFLSIPSKKLVFTGNPIRKFRKITKNSALNYFNLRNKKTIFVYGGSQGSSPINKFMSEITCDLLSNDIQIIWQTGLKDYEFLQNKFEHESILIEPFFKEIAYVYCASDLVICRAGAISIAEVAYFALPSIIIPFPHAAANHQLKNALQLKRNKAALLIEEKNLTANLLKENIIDLIKNKNERERISQNIKKLAVDNSAERIVKAIRNRLL